MKKNAFTLIEIVVSLGILALGILAIFALIPTGVQQTKKGHDQSKAIILAQSKMEEIISIAAENWDTFNSYDHRQFSGSGFEPKYMGPNSDVERQIWGWEATNPGSTPLEWVPKLGYQWEWHFIGGGTPNPTSPLNPADPDGTLALITLTVSWPQDWSTVGTPTDPSPANSEQQAITNINDYGTGGYVLTNSIQFVRLISYVSKGL